MDETLRFELCRHGSRIWRYTVEGARTFGDDVLPHTAPSSVEQALAAWANAEQLRETAVDDHIDDADA